MGKRCVITNRWFTDEFDLPLHEDAADDFYTVDEIKREVEKRIVKLASLSAEYRISVDSIVRYEIGGLRLQGNKAIAETEPVDTHKYIFRISKQATRKCYTQYLDTIIYHELCHMLQVDFLISAHILSFVGDELSYDIDQKDTVEFFYEADDGHTKLWYSFVKIVNIALAINPPVDRFFNANIDISDTFLESTFSRDRMVIHNRAFTDDFSWLIKEENK